MPRFLYLLLIICFTQSCTSRPDDQVRSVRPEKEDMTVMQLFFQNDCFSCHKIDGKSIGPAYLRVANRYKDQPDQREYLAKKIIEGGGGIWGGAVMSRHPFLKSSETSKMANWIISLAKHVPMDKNMRHVKLEVLSEVGEIESLDTLSRFELFSDKVQPYINVGVEFRLHADLEIAATEKALFHLQKKEGAALYLDGQVIIISDTLQREAIVELTSGIHKLEVRYVHEAGRQISMSLRWTGESNSLYRIVGG